MTIIFLLSGLLPGIALAWFVWANAQKEQQIINDRILQLDAQVEQVKELKNNAEQAMAVASSRLEDEKREHYNTKNERQSIHEKNELLNKENASLVAENKNFKLRIEEQKIELENLNKKLTTEFENIANRLLTQSGEKLQKQGSEQIDTILKPFKDRLIELKTQISDTYEKDTQQRIRLHEQVKQLVELNNQISHDAKNLTNALKSNSKVQGDWGEEVLENILQNSGLRKGYEYDLQSSFTDNTGKIMRPDMVVHYPDQRDIIIDSKVSLTDYERYISAETIEEQATHLKAHLNSIKQHIKELSEKNYQDIYEIASLDFVMMFIPIEGAYYLAMEQDRALWQYAYEKKILLINPTNLIAALKMISNLWQQDFQNKNVMEIARQSGNLYDAFVMLLDDISKLDKKFSETTALFEGVQKRISTGKGNLISRVEKLKALGAKTKKDLPDQYQSAIEE
ncbi:MAG: DNA recombination protein RmuC [Bacteroidales bacterium]|nr:DNA recombination protein RmuC [Bacteroidales bacterium]